MEKKEDYDNRDNNHRCRRRTLWNEGGRRMTQEDYDRLKSQIGVLKKVAKEYHGKTIDNIIQQMEARVKQYRQ